MKTILPRLLFLYFVTRVFSAQASDNPCLLPNVHQYSVLVNPFTTDPTRANLRFQVLGDARKEEAIVFLPGGPGQEVIAEYDPIHYDQDFASAPGVPMLVLQARGSGCNEEAFQRFPESVFTTEILAADALQLIRQLNLKRYWLYGASYGTHVATVLAHLIARDPSITKPQGIVLTGVGALPLPRGRSAADDFIDQWNLLKPKLNPAGMKVLLNSNQPLGFSKELWSEYLLDRLGMGWWFTGPKPFHRTLAVLDTLAAQQPDAIQALQKSLTDFQAAQSVDSTRLNQAILCHEISEIDEDRTMLVGSNIVRIHPQKNHCDGQRLDRPYYSSRYQFTTPLFYFQGRLDPYTPFREFADHYRSHTQAPRFAAISTYGGHGALYTSYLNCRQALWGSVLARGAGFKDAVKTCAAPTEVYMSP